MCRVHPRGRFACAPCESLCMACSLCAYLWVACGATAEGLTLSGIVAVLMTGITMNKYTFVALTDAGRDFSSRCFKILLFISESAVFVLVCAAGRPAGSDFRWHCRHRLWCFCAVSMYDHAPRVGCVVLLVIVARGRETGV
jgi:NhaP-type Na+/H+ or K+/H+ antiporter